MRARTVAALLGVGVAASGCEAGPPVVRASETRPPASPTTDPVEARLIELRATDMFDEFAEHERAAQADGARLAWENFAPIVDGERVEWTNKAELWDSIAPKIRDEALLLGPEYREPLWDTRNAIPNGISMAWNDEDTEGRGHFVEFSAAFESHEGPAERVWGYLIRRDAAGRGHLSRAMPSLTIRESDHRDAPSAIDWLRDQSWMWIFSEGRDEA